MGLHKREVNDFACGTKIGVVACLGRLRQSPLRGLPRRRTINDSIYRWKFRREGTPRTTTHYSDHKTLS
jgi:hypothetical protein